MKPLTRASIEETERHGDACDCQEVLALLDRAEKAESERDELMRWWNNGGAPIDQMRMAEHERDEAREALRLARKDARHDAWEELLGEWQGALDAAGLDVDDLPRTWEPVSDPWGARAGRLVVALTKERDDARAALRLAREAILAIASILVWAGTPEARQANDALAAIEKALGET